MDKKTDLKKSMYGMAVLITICIFAVCIVMVLLQCADSYKRISTRNDFSCERRICVSYLREKLHQAEVPPIISSYGDGDCIVLDETIGGERYRTWIYCYDGWLWEYFGGLEKPESPDLGEKVLRAAHLHVMKERHMLHISLDDNTGMDLALNLCLRNEVGV